MIEPKLSIIIPVYNGERCIAKSVRSILDQQFADFELWIVDDGSVDGTARIIDELAKQDARIHVIHQPNMRAYAARLAGVRASKSEYVAFVDADDEVEPAMYTRMIAFADQHHCDVVQCDVASPNRRERDPEVIVGAKEVLKRVVIPRIIRGVNAMCMWDKIYRRSALPTEWEESRLLMFDDLAFNMQVFRSVTTMGYLHEGLYRYQVNDGSSVRNFSRRNIEDFKEIIRLRKLILPRYGVQEYSALNDTWMFCNAWNYIKFACAAPRIKMRERVSFVREVAVYATQQADSTKYRPLTVALCSKKVGAILITPLLRALKCAYGKVRRG